MISIIIPTYNNNGTLPLALQSIRRQTVDDWECVIVDDGSCIPASTVIGSVFDSRITLVKHARNQGRGAARVTGLQVAAGELIAWQDADDFSHPERLREQLAVLQAHPEVDFVGSSVFATDGTQCLGVRRFEQAAPRLLGPRQLPPVVHATLMFRRSVLKDVEYQAANRTSEDLAFLTEALPRHRFMNLARPLYAYRYIESLTIARYWQSARLRTSIALSGSKKWHPIAWRQVAGYFARFAAHAVAHPLGLNDWAALRAYSKPQDLDLLEFKTMMEAISTPPPGTL